MAGVVESTACEDRDPPSWVDIYREERVHMKSAVLTLKTIQSVLACAVLVAACTGCASQHKDLVQASYVSLEPTLTASLAHPPEVYETDGELVVEGRLDSGDITKGGHIDVWVNGPDGTTVYEAAVNFRKPLVQTQTSGPRGGYRGPRTNPHATYSVRFPGLPPQGSVVHVKFDPQPHAKTGDK